MDYKAVVKCDSSLEGTHDKIVDTLSFFGLEINVITTLANCPTITSPVDIKIKTARGGKSEKDFVGKLSRDQRAMLKAIKDKALAEFTDRTKKVVYSKTY